MKQINPSKFIINTQNQVPQSREDLESWFKGYLDGNIEDYHMTAWLMAVLLKGLTFEEIAVITEIYANSGSRFNPSEFKKPAVDKHSTGGVGDKTSFILAPLVASTGLIVPMISGRALGHTGGTLDKLEAIPGFNTQIEEKDFIQQCNEIGMAIIGQTADIAPLDKRIYALRDVTGTVSSVALICASILSKKLAEGLQGLVMDVKQGNGAFIDDPAEGRELAENLVKVADAMNLKTHAILTDMNQPLGLYSGNMVEIIESLEILEGKHQNEDSAILSLKLATEMVKMGLGLSTEQAKKIIADNVCNGKGLEIFEKVMHKQAGGKIYKTAELQKLQDENSVKIGVIADEEGYVQEFATKELGWLLVELGGGRKKITDEINPYVGFKKLTKVGDWVSKGDELFEVYLPKNFDMSEANQIQAKFVECLTLGETRKVNPLIISRIYS